MADDTSKPPVSDDNKGGSSDEPKNGGQGNNGKSDQDWEKLVEQRNSLKARLKALEDEKRKVEDDKNAQAGNVEALRKSALDRETELNNTISRLQSERDNAALQSQVVSVLAELCVNADDAFVFVKDKFEVKADDSGKLVVRPKDSSLATKDYLQKFFESKPYMLKNPRAEGAGTSKTSEGSKAGYTYEQLEAMSPTEYAAKVKENPKLAVIYASKGKQTG